MSYVRTGAITAAGIAALAAIGVFVAAELPEGSKSDEKLPTESEPAVTAWDPSYEDAAYEAADEMENKAAEFEQRSLNISTEADINDLVADINRLHCAIVYSAEIENSRAIMAPKSTEVVIDFNRFPLENGINYKTCHKDMALLGLKGDPVKALIYGMSESNRARWSAPVLKRLNALSLRVGNRLLLMTKAKLERARESQNDRKVSLKKESN